MENTPDTLFGKMFSAHSQATKAATSLPCCKPSRKLPAPTYMCLNLKEGKTDLLGNTQVKWSETAGVLHGEQWTRNTGEYPSAVVESTLSQILVPNAPEKYYLSAKTCQGILNRAERRGKKLPEMLKAALDQMIERENSTNPVQ